MSNTAYNNADEYFSEDHEGWRDLFNFYNAQAASHPLPQRDNIVNSPSPTYADSTTVPVTRHRNNNSYWAVPAHSNPRDALGTRYKSRSKEKRRAEKKQARIDEEKKYPGSPETAQKCNDTFFLMNRSLPIPKLVGENECYLNQIRDDCKAFLWYDPEDNVIHIAAETKEAVSKAYCRIRNWFFRCCSKPEGGTARLVQQPSKNYTLTFGELPPGFVTYPERKATMFKKPRILEASMKKDDDLISKQVLSMNKRNADSIKKLLSSGLESIRLNDWNLRLKVRFGQICIIEYPDKRGKDLTVEDVSDMIFTRCFFKSALAPCISTTKAGLDLLFEYLTSEKGCYEFSDNPKTSFSIKARQYPTAAPARVPGQRSPPRGDMCNTVIKVSFTDDGNSKLWNTMTDCNDLVDISCADIESHYSWDLKLQHARQLPNDDINSPHEKFAHSLSVSSDNNRPIMVTTDDYIPQIVTQKTKWLFGWNNDYRVEICKDEIWDIDRVDRADKELPLDLSPIEPHRTLFKVSLYKESWVNRLAENLNLRIGEAPSWTLRDFFASSNENTATLMKNTKKFNEIPNGHIATLMENIKEFNEILNSAVPLYYSASLL